MGYNKIPLALRYNDTTNNAEGLIEFQLNLSDVGNVCSATPSNGQGLVWSGGGDGSWCPSTLPTGGGGGTPTLPTGNNGDLLINTGGGTTYLASAASDAGIMQLDPYFAAGDDGAVAQWDGTKLEVKFPDALFIRVTQDNTLHVGENIAKGDAVYATTTTESGGRIYVGLANAADPSRMPAIGIAEANITAGSNGKIISFGRADGVDTTFDGVATVGDTLYVGTTNGKLAANKPDQPTELIQNVGIVTQTGTSGRIKVTGVGRSNDIPNNLDVVGSVTVGNTVISQTDAKLANVDANHILISTATSATSSIASSTLFGDYVKSVNTQTPTAGNVSLTTDNIPQGSTNSYITTGEQTKLGHITVAAAVDINNIQPDDLNGTAVAANKIVSVDSAGTGFEAGVLGDLNDVTVGTPGTGDSLFYDEVEGGWTVSSPPANFVDGPTTSATFSSIEVDDIKVNRLLESRPTCITHFSDWLSLDVRNNGYSPSLAGGASHVQDSNLVTMNTTEYGIGVLRLKTSTSITNSQSRVMTYDSTVAPSTCGVSFAARVCPSGAWTSGVNEGVITMGIHNRSNSINLHPNAGAWFQYDHSSSKWQAITGWFTVSSNTVTTVDATPESFQVLQIMIDENWQTFEFYIDGVNVATHLISTHNVPTSSRYGFTFSVRNGSLAGPGSVTDGGNELFLDWDYRKLTHTATDRGEGYIKKTLSGE